MNSNPLRIIGLLDHHLRRPFDLYVYGRSALALGFASAPAAMHATMDVDAILPARDILAIEANDDFWQAQARTNEDLGETGLYFTHLFEDRQVILGPDWLSRAVAIAGTSFVHLRLYRPSTEDLILTKMMRVDPQDRDDVEFLMRQTDIDLGRLRTLLSAANIPDVAEIRDAFRQNLAWLAPRISD